MADPIAARIRPALEEPGGSFERSLEEKVRSGAKFLAVYVTAGLPEPSRFTELVERLARSGADVIEIGIPFSDPIMDGPVIQRATKFALEAGITPSWALEAASKISSAGSLGAGLVVMTYSNLAFRRGLDAFARDLHDAGVGGAILADLPLEESAPWERAAVEAGVAPILLAAPTSSDQRLAEVCSRSRGFVYGISLLGVTGPRKSLGDRAKEIGDRLKKISGIPVGVGIGISNGAQAAEVSRHCDGVIVGSALIQRILDSPGAAPAIEAAESFVAELRAGLDR